MEEKAIKLHFLREFLLQSVNLSGRMAGDCRDKPLS